MDIKVSVLCLAYNHENYIRECLDGIINQVTDFDFEVIIHDDASTDNTTTIIKEYENKYPQLIKPIYETENQYSKDVNIFKDFFKTIPKGKYFAICECDDCWIDNKKLQLQYDYMEQNEDCFAVATDGIVNNVRQKTQQLFARSKSDRDYSLEECVLIGGGLFLTCSLFVKKEVILNMPDCFYCKGVGDFQIVNYSAILGRVHFIAKCTCKYNYGVANSWTDRQNKQLNLNHYDNLIKMAQNINDYYDNKYANIFNKYIEKICFLKCLLLEDYKQIIRAYKKNLYKESKRIIFKVYLGAYFPNLYNFIKNRKK